VARLGQIEVAVANGKAIPQACKDLAISQQRDYRWRKEYGGLLLGACTVKLKREACTCHRSSNASQRLAAIPRVGLASGDGHNDQRG
jgi:hypothetical protein